MEVLVYDMIIDPETDEMGLKQMSMVNSPAIMTAWAKFNDSEVKFSILNEDQRIVFGPALIPDLPIKRVVMGQEFYLKITKDEILKTAIKFAKDGIATRIDTNHDNNLISDSVIFESFVTDSNRIKPESVKGYETLAEGTLFFTGKINNLQQWAKVQSGELTGWSIDGLFKFQPVETLTDKEVQTVIREILSKQ